MTLASGWLEVEPNSADAACASVVALAMLGHDDDALAVIAETDLMPRVRHLD